LFFYYVFVVGYIPLICNKTLTFGQVQIRHEQAKVLLPDSHVPISTTSKDSQRSCEYDDSIICMQLRRTWCYKHEIWL